MRPNIDNIEIYEKSRKEFLDFCFNLVYFLAYIHVFSDFVFENGDRRFLLYGSDMLLGLNAALRLFRSKNDSE